jgi:hypothetical protein
VRVIGFLLRAAVRMLVLAAVLYGTFFIPIGPRTLYGHLSRIASTQEAHELFGAVSTAAKDAGKVVASKVERVRAGDQR